jgi:pimeloyl-ACP methyl ester carboxylesterase
MALNPRKVIAAAEALPPGGINELIPVRIGGIPQWISIRGADRSNPILLFISGGPGDPMMPESWTFQRPWEDFFTVVQWDQRDAGKTFSAAHRVADRSMTMAELQSDTNQLITWLRHRYHKRKIFLVGFSFGSILGLRVAIQHPNWLYAYVGVGQVVNAYQNEVVGYRETLAKAEAVHNQAAIEGLKSIAPYPGAAGPTLISKVIIERKWDEALGGMLYGRTKDDEARFWALSPDYSAYDVRSAELGEMSSVQILLPQLLGVSFDDNLVFKCPVIFFAGAHDRTTPESLVAAYYKRIRAPEKRFFLIKNAAHYVVNESPGIVLVDLVRYVRPLDRRLSIAR